MRRSGRLPLTWRMRSASSNALKACRRIISPAWPISPRTRRAWPCCARSCVRRKRSSRPPELDAQRTADVLEKHAIRAPFGGVVVDRSAQSGEMISPMSAGRFTRTGICTIVDMDSIEIEVDVNEAFIGRIHADTAVDAVLDAYPDWTIPGGVIAIVPTANREKATVKVRIGLNQKDARILPDMAVKVTFLKDRRTARTETYGLN